MHEFNFYSPMYAGKSTIFSALAIGLTSSLLEWRRMLHSILVLIVAFDRKSLIRRTYVCNNINSDYDSNYHFTVYISKRNFLDKIDISDIHLTFLFSNKNCELAHPPCEKHWPEQEGRCPRLQCCCHSVLPQQHPCSRSYWGKFELFCPAWNGSWSCPTASPRI